MENQQYARACHLLVLSKQYHRALEMCESYDIPVSEEMAEAMTPEKTERNADERAQLLLRIAKCARNQGQYHLACKKYTQAGDKLKVPPPPPPPPPSLHLPEAFHRPARVPWCRYRTIGE